MRFLANENIPLASIQRLQAAGHDEVAVAQTALGSSDVQVLQQAAREQRMVLTFDRDYGELIFRYHLPAPSGVIYFRFQPSTPAEPAERLLHLLDVPDRIRLGRFIVVDRDQLRDRPLPRITN